MSNPIKTAAERLVDPETVKSAPFRARDLSVSYDNSHPEIIDFAEAFIKELKARGLPFFIQCLYRSSEEQNRLYKAGTTLARAGQSPHNHGLAVDIVHFGRWWDLTREEWAVIGAIGKDVARRRKLKITWGGDWRFYDPAHWEISDWKNRTSRRKGQSTRPFAQAFQEARRAGLSDFYWRDKLYSTEVR